MNPGNNILVVIAARGGSKGIKNKNIKPLMGKPLIAYSILQARAWGKAADIVCSTDSERIAALAKKYGAKIPFIRPKYLAGDHVAKIEVIRHALLTCEEIYKKVYEVIVDLDVTAPIRRISDLDNCLEIFERKKPKTLFSVVKSRRNPYFNMVERKDGGKISLCKHTKKPVFSRQKAPQVYSLNASIYYYSCDYLKNKNNKKIISDDSQIYVMDDISAIDIDNEFDLKFINFLIKERIWKSEI